ncbi:MAG: amidophosphoribosyltransferase, partial [bacterium]|nr:amidophosphoribosyltransferase [bacterium]
MSKIELISGISSLESEKPRENCAVVGAYSRSSDVARIAVNGLVELNHRGQEGSGITLANGCEFQTVKDSGLAGIVFTVKHSLPYLSGAFVAIGHNRYSTSGSLAETQPFVENDIAI